MKISNEALEKNLNYLKGSHWISMVYIFFFCSKDEAIFHFLHSTYQVSWHQNTPLWFFSFEHLAHIISFFSFYKWKKYLSGFCGSLV